MQISMEAPRCQTQNKNGGSGAQCPILHIFLPFHFYECSFVVFHFLSVPFFIMCSISIFDEFLCCVPFPFFIISGPFLFYDECSISLFLS